MQLPEATLCRFCAAELIPISDKPQTTRPHRSNAAAFLDENDDCALCGIIRNNWSLLSSKRGGISADNPEAAAAVPVTVSLREAREFASGVSWALLRVEAKTPHDSRLYTDEFSITTCKSNCEPPQARPPLSLIFSSDTKLLAPASNRGVWSAQGSLVPERLSTVRSWLTSCTTNHVSCKLSAYVPVSLPKRLLYVGSSHCRLVDTVELDPGDTKYVALSHCWGPTLPIRTLMQNLSRFRDGIPPGDLPQTFLDAIMIVRAVGLEYLWIDALCIVQDDPADWEAEASKMMGVYSEGVFTIAASEASQGSEGCFQPPSRASQTPLGLFAIRKGSPDKEVELVRVQKGHVRDASRRTVLSSRGWTFQEQLLSRRILHCMGAELHWQCSTCYETEPGAVFETTQEGRAAVSELRRLDAGASAKPPEAVWCEWMALYSRRSFTYWKDRLPALAGIVQHYEEITGDRAILGMWETSFPQELLWIRLADVHTDKTSVDTPNIPSWSWLACPAEIGFDIWQSTRRSTSRDIVENHASLVKWNVTWQTVPFISPVTTACLVLTGPLRETLLEPSPGTANMSPMFFMVDGEIPDQNGPDLTSLTCTGQFDAGPRRSAIRLTCLLLRSRMNIDSRVIRETFLMLEKVPNPQVPKTFRRIGIGCFIGNTPKFDWTVQEEVELV